jgi:D-alanyl-D-alanine carboxypeptidase
MKKRVMSNQSWLIRLTLTVIVLLGLGCTVGKKDAPVSVPTVIVKYKTLPCPLDSLDAKYGFVGSLIVNLDSNDTLLSVNTTRSFIPASIVKLFTVALADSLLPGINFSVLFTDSARQNLYWRGCGLPFADSLKDVAATLQRDLQRNYGKRADTLFFASDLAESNHYQAGRTMDDFLAPYAPIPTATPILDNLWHLQGDAAALNYRPVDMQPVFSSDITLFAEKKVRLHYSADNQLKVFLPEHKVKRSRGFWLAALRPDLRWQNWLFKQLSTTGFAAQNAAIHQYRSTPKKLRPVTYFPVLGRDSMAVKANRYSDNFAAMQLRYACQIQNPADDILPVRQFYQKYFPLTRGDRLYDGAGLSRFNLLTIATTGRLLQSRYSGPLYQTLAVSGEDGTLETRFPGLNKNIKLYGKTGSMTHVRNYAGFARNGRNAHFLVILFANNYAVKGAEMDEMFTRIINHYLTLEDL